MVCSRIPVNKFTVSRLELTDTLICMSAQTSTVFHGEKGLSRLVHSQNNLILFSFRTTDSQNGEIM